MHKRRARECGHLKWIEVFYAEEGCAGDWEDQWSSCIDNDVAAPWKDGPFGYPMKHYKKEDWIWEEDARMWVAEQVVHPDDVDQNMLLWGAVTVQMLALARALTKRALGSKGSGTRRSPYDQSSPGRRCVAAAAA